MKWTLKQQNLVEVHLATLLFGFVGLLVQAISSSLLMMAFGRSLLAAITLGIIIIFTKTNFKLHRKEDYAYLILLGVIQTFQWLTFFKSIKLAGVGIGIMSLYVYPVIVAIAEPLFFKEKLKKKHLLTAVLIVLGVICATPEISLQNQTTQGILWGILSATLVAFPFLIHRKFIHQYSSFTLSFYKTGTSAILLLTILLWTSDFTFTLKDAGLIAILGVIFTAIPYYLFIKSLQTLKARQSSAIMSFEIVYGMLFSFLILSEEPSVRSLIGGIIILSTTLYLTRQVKNEVEE